MVRFWLWQIAKPEVNRVSLAALVMYQRARKISNLLGDPANFSSLAELQLEAYVVAMNALSLLDQKTAWIAIPATVETGHEVWFFKSPIWSLTRGCSRENEGN